MKKLRLEWRHYAKVGATCERCSSTGTTISELLNELAGELKAKGITVTFIETLLPEEAMAQSNLILLNGVPIEDVLEDARASENSCQSCSCLTGMDTNCRTVEHEGVVYEAIPADLIRKAVYRVTGMTE